MVVTGLGKGGLEHVAADLVVGLRAQGYDAAVFCITKLGYYAEELGRIGVPVWDCRESPFRVRGFPAQLVRQLARFRPNIIHGHSGAWLPAAVAKLVLRRPALVFTDHGRYPPEPRWRAWVERWCYGRTDRLVTVSSPLAAYVQQFLRLPQRPVVILNGVDLASFRPGPPTERLALRRDWGVAETDIVFVSVGRLEPVKNHALLLSALAEAGRAFGPMHLAIVGAGSLETELRALAGRLGLGSRVHFLGFRTDVLACLLAADVFVLPSVTEGLPMCLLEAMATGLPTVASRVGGVPDALGNPPAGMLVEPNDAAGLARALVAVAADPALRAELAARALCRAEAHSFGSSVAQYMELYSDVLRSSSAGDGNRE